MKFAAHMRPTTGQLNVLAAGPGKGRVSRVTIALQGAFEVNGYNVLQARNGREALDLVRGHDHPIHLLLTDVVMPQMSGRQLAESVADIQPGIRVLYMSGYTDGVIAHHGVLDDGVAYLQKPFTADFLARKVREVLDARAARRSADTAKGT